MTHKTQADWIAQIRKSIAEVEVWLAEMPEKHWRNRIEGNRTNKDLVGHLAAWSDFLTDQIENLARGNPENIKQIEIDNWNATQIETRCDWSVARILQEWEKAAHRTLNVIIQLPADVFSQQWSVPWDEEHVAIDDLLALWLLHLKQHQEAWEPTHQRRKNERMY